MEKEKDIFKFDPGLVVPNEQLAAALLEAVKWEKFARSERAVRLKYEEILTIPQKKKLGLLPLDRKQPSRQKKKDRSTRDKS